MTLADDEFRCEQCRGVFKKARSDEEALAEAEAEWHGQLEDPVVVCDDCFQMMQAKYPIDDYLFDQGLSSALIGLVDRIDTEDEGHVIIHPDGTVEDAK